MQTTTPVAAPFLALNAALFAVGCASSSAPADRGPDRTRPIEVELPVDGGPPPVPDGGPVQPTGGATGAACTSDGQCRGDDALCIPPPSGFPGGYCTNECSTPADCADGAICAAIGASFLGCLDLCDPDAAVRECRPGYGCAPDSGVCLPGCTDATDCPEGAECAPGGGNFRAGRCFEADSAPGDACTSSVMCPADGFCASEGFLGWPGGVCLVPGCDPSAGASTCPEGATCLAGFGGGVCVAACADDTDCRADFACRGGACLPACTPETACTGGRVCNEAAGICDEPFDPRDFGRACAGDDVCQGGTCFREFETGYPGSYCVFEGCTPGEAGSCPGTGVCVPTDGGGVCHLACTGRCTRDGYACLPADPADPTGPTACLPRCTGDDDCANDGFVCDTTTGLCGAG